MGMYDDMIVSGAAMTEMLTNLKGKFDEFAGPSYDEMEHGFNFPTTSKMEYNTEEHGFIFG